MLPSEITKLGVGIAIFFIGVSFGIFILFLSSKKNCKKKESLAYALTLLCLGLTTGLTIVACKRDLAVESYITLKEKRVEIINSDISASAKEQLITGIDSKMEKFENEFSPACWKIYLGKTNAPR